MTLETAKRLHSFYLSSGQLERAKELEDKHPELKKKEQKKPKEEKKEDVKKSER